MKRIFVFFALVIASLNSLQAVTILWGDAVGDFIFESDGTTPVDNTHNIELGTFSDGFLPEMENAADWDSNWHTLDVGTYSSVTGRLAGSVTLLNTPAGTGSIIDGDATDPATFFFEKPAYVWIYDQNTTTDGSVDLEWALLSNPDGGTEGAASAWTFPSETQSAAHTDAKLFALSDAGVTANFGAETSGTTPTSGDGMMMAEPTATYAIQTYTIIPEPSSASLIMIAMLGFVLNRRRREFSQ